MERCRNGIWGWDDGQSGSRSGRTKRGDRSTNQPTGPDHRGMHRSTIRSIKGTPAAPARAACMDARIHKHRHPHPHASPAFDFGERCSLETQRGLGLGQLWPLARAFYGLGAQDRIDPTQQQWRSIPTSTGLDFSRPPEAAAALDPSIVARSRSRLCMSTRTHGGRMLTPSPNRSAQPIRGTS